MDRIFVTNSDCSYTLIEGERRQDLPASTTLEALNDVCAAFFTADVEPPAPGDGD